MGYTRKNWQNGDKANADNMNHMDLGIYNNSLILDNLKNIVYNSGTASNTGEAIRKNIASITLSNGRYLILASMGSDTSDSTLQVILYITPGTNATAIMGRSNYRGTMIGGGGVTGWRIIDITEETGTVDLDTYVYTGKTMTGQICAIKIG